MKKSVNNSTEPAPVMEFHDVSYRYSVRPVLQNINFRLSAGEMKTILGPNGSGKSTLVKLGLGILRAESGAVSLFGSSAHKFRDWRRVGYVPQSALDRSIMKLFPCTAKEVVAMGLYGGVDALHLLSGRRKKFTDRVHAAMETMGVGGLGSQPFVRLSPGQQQRVVVAQALVNSPQLLVLDEPDTTVDPSGKQHLHEMLQSISAELGIAVLLISHDIGIACKLDNWCICLNCTKVYEGLSSGLSDEILETLYGHKVHVLDHGN